ncbi:hypothetical protein E2P81_ATG09757 [Venturia nashicola]|nr:hypothetical protein E2P81_ATG09757 [Venturia nashicola]
MLLLLAGLLYVGFSTGSVLHKRQPTTVTTTATQTLFSTVYTQTTATVEPQVAEDRASTIYTDWNRDFMITVFYGYNNGITEQRFQISGKMCPGWKGNSALEQELRKMGLRTTPLQNGTEPGETKRWDYRIWGAADQNFDHTLLRPAILQTTGCTARPLVSEPPQKVEEHHWKKYTDNYRIDVTYDGVHEQTIRMHGKVIHKEKYERSKGLRAALERRGVRIVESYTTEHFDEFTIKAFAKPNFHYEDLEQAVCEGGGCGWKPPSLGPPWPQYQEPSDPEGKKDYKIFKDAERAMIGSDGNRFTDFLLCAATLGFGCFWKAVL